MDSKNDLWMDPNYIRPSSLKYKDICPNFEQDNRDDELMEAARQGDRIHRALEIKDGGDLEEDDLPLYEFAKQTEADIVKRHGLDQEGVCNYRELKMTSPRAMRDGKRRYEGMIDDFYEHTTAALGVLVDWKCGEWRVDHPSGNLQLQDYTFKLFRRFRHLRTIVAYIVAPKREEVTSATYTREDMVWVERRLRRVRSGARGDREIPNKHCEWCGRAAFCDALRENMKGLRVADTTLPEVHGKLDLTKPMDLEAALKLRPVFNKFAKQWSDAVKEAGIESLKMGMELGEFYVTDRRGKRKITDVSKLLEIAEKMGVPRVELKNMISVSMKDVINAIRDKQPRGAKGAAEMEFIQTLHNNKLLEYGESYPVIQREKA